MHRTVRLILLSIVGAVLVPVAFWTLHSLVFGVRYDPSAEDRVDAEAGTLALAIGGAIGGLIVELMWRELTKK